MKHDPASRCPLIVVRRLVLRKRHDLALGGEAWRLVEAPGHQVVDAALRVVVENGTECGGDMIDRVGVQLERAVLQETDQAGPVRQGVADVLGQPGFLRDARQLGFQPRLERGDDGR